MDLFHTVCLCMRAHFFKTYFFFVVSLTGRYPYTSGYFSEPDPATYDSDASDFKFATLDRRRLQSNNRDKENEYMSSTMPRNTTVK